MIWKLERIIRKLRRGISRSEWSSRLLQLAHNVEQSSLKPGLLLIQIDGLSYNEFRKALETDKLPFLKSLLLNEKYMNGIFYSGIPSSTPAVQAEIFYGQKSAVPAFAFYRPAEKKTYRMFDPECAIKIESELQQRSDGLLKGGSSYSNVYTGGAEESHFCSQNLGWAGLHDNVNWFRIACVFILFFPSLIRIFGLSIVETIISFYDCIKGILKGESIGKELKFIPTRIGICIILREWIRIGVKLDLVRGLPIIHMNLLGYDEQAHRRGPKSHFAHWTLKGIDKTIKDLFYSAHRAHRRDYSVWIYSDHGQEHVTSYQRKNNCYLQEKLEQILFPSLKGKQMHSIDQRGIAHQRGLYLGRKKWQKSFGLKSTENSAKKNQQVRVAAMGPIGLVTLPGEIDDTDKPLLARKIVNEAKVPTVLFANQKQIWAFKRDSEFILTNENLKDILGYAHPKAEWLCDDLKNLVNHPDSGHFICLGWNASDPMSFPIENGAHAGPGEHETQGFYLVPGEAFGNEIPPKHIRGIFLNQMANCFLGRLPFNKHKPLRNVIESYLPNPALASPEKLNVLTWNIHSCRGMDGKVSIQRIIRVIQQAKPDIVALQEVDHRTERSENYNQAGEIAAALGKGYSFHAVRSEGIGHYGLAILSRYPILEKSEHIYTRYDNLKNKPAETRGYQNLLIDWKSHKLLFINTHLGLHSKERKQQSLQLKEIISDISASGTPCILCGDLNSLPNSPPYKILTQSLNDVQPVGKKRIKTFPARKSVFGIDHILISEDWKIESVKVLNSQLAKKASDHLPLLAILEPK